MCGMIPTGLCLCSSTLDSLQFAVALDLFRGGAAQDLAAGDKVVCKVAAVEGMPVIEPELSPL